MDPEKQKNENVYEDRIESFKLTNGSEVIIAGIGKHTTSLTEAIEVLSSLEKTVTEKGPDKIVFLGEGSSVDAGISKPSTEVAIFGGDQQAMACRAQELKVSIIDSWDMSLQEQFSFASQSSNPENTVLWFLSQSSIALHSQGKEINLENCIKMLSDFGLTKEKIVTSLNSQEMTQSLINETSIDNFIRKKAGFSLSEINQNEENYKTFSQIAFPGNTNDTTSRLPAGLREASLVAGKLGVEREIRFKKKIRQYANQGKTIFISCGGGHVDNFANILKNIN